jgi:hypothetical protein
MIVQPIKSSNFQHGIRLIFCCVQRERGARPCDRYDRPHRIRPPCSEQYTCGLTCTFDLHNNIMGKPTSHQCLRVVCGIALIACLTNELQVLVTHAGANLSCSNWDSSRLLSRFFCNLKWVSNLFTIRMQPGWLSPLVRGVKLACWVQTCVILESWTQSFKFDSRVEAPVLSVL